MKTRVILGAVCVAACLAATADAKDIPAGGITQDELATWFQGQGISATVGSLPQPEPSILGTYLAIISNQLRYTVFFHDCKAGRCATLLIVGAVKPCNLTLEQVNKWNSERRWLRAYYDATEQLCVGEMDIVADGSSYENLVKMFGTWEHVLPEYINYSGTGAFVASNQNGRAVLPGLVIGKTTYADVLGANGQPRSDEQLAQGGHVVRYPFEVLRSHESGDAIVAPLVGRDSAGALAVLTFDSAGILQAYGAAPGEGGRRAFGSYNGLNATGAIGKLIANSACGATCK